MSASGRRSRPVEALGHQSWRASDTAARASDSVGAVHRNRHAARLIRACGLDPARHRAINIYSGVGVRRADMTGDARDHRRRYCPSLMPVWPATRRHLIDCPATTLSTLANWAAVSIRPTPCRLPHEIKELCLAYIAFFCFADQSSSKSYRKLV